MRKVGDRPHTTDLLFAGQAVYHVRLSVRREVNSDSSLEQMAFAGTVSPCGILPLWWCHFYHARLFVGGAVCGVAVAG